ncbi:MAG: dienelactone hydrolase family protein [Phycisphaerae bacterium]|nr:dienelactone hydrolase family protein [Phycisphaerae bacterium]
MTRNRGSGQGFLVLPAVAALILTLPATTHAWPGHDWNEWKKVTTWTKPELKTDQAGRKDLAPLLETREGDGKKIDGIKAWEAKRARIADALARIIGEPTGLTVLPPEAQQDREQTLDDHVRRHIRIRTEADDWIPAYLLLPKDMPSMRLPTMICLHQTVPQGKDEPCGIKGSSDLSFALQLVRRGYVCIAPDVIGFGERIPAGAQPYANSLDFYRRHPKWSFVGKMNWDIARIIDWLETLPFVDPLQIGCIGHSHGAYGSLYAAAFEPRISLVIASCGFTTLRSDPKPDRWSHLTALIPQLGTYLPDVASIPFDWHEICALVAPRPLYVWYTTRDDIFPNTDNLDAMFKDVRSVYGLYGAANDLAWSFQDSGHEFPGPAREAAYTWLEQRLFPLPDLRAKPTDLKEWQARREVIKRVIRRTIGTPTTQPASPDLKTISHEKLAKYERRLIEYSVDKDERVRAYLCLPARRSGQSPAVLVLHQTAAEGKREAVGVAGDKSLAFGSELAERGYITLSPDSITAGERIDADGAFDTRGHYLRHPDISAMGKMLYDAQRALDVLVAVEGIDRNRLVTIGHSLGAEEALMLAAFDERVKAAVASCGYATFRAENQEGRLRWARDHWFSYMPRLRPVFQTGRLPHWDWDDVLRLAAPRAVYQYNTKDDQIFTESESAFEAGEAARPIWKLYGRENLLVNVLRPGKHAVADQDKLEMYEWLDRQWKRR